MALTEVQIKYAKPKTKPVKLFDSHGLYLLVVPEGGKRWRWKYRFEHKEQLLSFGLWPEVSLKEARERRNDARKLLHAGINPSAERKAAKTPPPLTQTEDTFAGVAHVWLAKNAPGWAASHTATIESRLENYVFERKLKSGALFGARPVGEIEAPEILEVLEPIEKSGTIETAHRILQVIGQIFRFAGASGKVKGDPTALLRGALTPKPDVKSFAAITDPEGVGAMVRAIRGYRGSLVVRSALELHLLTFLRSKELRLAGWPEVNFATATWTVPAARMKMRRKVKVDHIVPLSRQALKVLRELKRVTGSGTYLFPGGRGPSRPLSENAVTAALRAMGFVELVDEVDKATGKPTGEKKEAATQTAHGFRSCASTLLNELGVSADVIEKQLAHEDKNKVRGAYNKAEHLPARRKMMQQYADYLDELADAKTLRATG